jgi:23S rRNA (pseudouridine1915-N3)-methyltransferase
MLKITLLFTEKRLAPTTLAGLAEYRKRLSRACQLDWQTGVTSLDTVTDSPVSQLIWLERQGKSLTSPEFSQEVDAWIRTGIRHVFFFLGPLPKSVRRTLLGNLSISPLALGNDTAGLLLAEQIYRAFRILGNQTYHK